MLIDRTHFHIFPRQEIGALSITLALQYFGGGLVSVFVPILFWKSGFTISSILFFYLLNSVYFILLTFLFLPLIEKLSDKMMMFLSIPPLVFYFLGLKFVAAMPVLFYILPLLLAVNAILFNIGYNIAFSKSSEDGHLGREIGTRDAITSFVQFSAPLIGGLLITSIGFQNTFFIVAAILILSVFPLFAFPRRTLESDGKRIEMLKYLGHASLLPFNFAGIGYAMEVIVGAVLWPLFVYLSSGKRERSWHCYFRRAFRRGDCDAFRGVPRGRREAQDGACVVGGALRICVSHESICRRPDFYCGEPCGGRRCVCGAHGRVDERVLQNNARGERPGSVYFEPADALPGCTHTIHSRADVARIRAFHKRILYGHLRFYCAHRALVHVRQ